MVGRWNFSHLLVFFTMRMSSDVKLQPNFGPGGGSCCCSRGELGQRSTKFSQGPREKMFRFMCDTDHLVCFRKYMHTNRQFSLRITTWWGHVCPFSGLVSFPRCRKGVMKVLLLHVFWEGNPSKNSVFFQGEFMAFCVRLVVNFIKEKSLEQNEPKIQCNYIKSTKFSN